MGAGARGLLCREGRGWGPAHASVTVAVCVPGDAPPWPMPLLGPRDVWGCGVDQAVVDGRSHQHR